MKTLFGFTPFLGAIAAPPLRIMILINFAKTMSPYFGSGRIIVFSATLRLDIVYLSQFIF